MLKYRRSEPALEGATSAANDDASAAAHEVLAMALEARVNRIARDLARETGKPVRHWLEQAARMLSPSDDSHLIIEVEGEPMFAVRRPSRR